MDLVSSNPTLSVSKDTYLVSIYFFIGPVGLNRFVTTTKFVDKFLSRGRVA